MPPLEVGLKLLAQAEAFSLVGTLNHTQSFASEMLCVNQVSRSRTFGVIFMLVYEFGVVPYSFLNNCHNLLCQLHF